MRGIEKSNPDTLYGVFGDAQWTNKDRLSDALLKDLIEHFFALPQGSQNVAPDLVGDAYEYLIKKFAETINKKALRKALFKYKLHAEEERFEKPYH